jgi:hypothetical protein
MPPLATVIIPTFDHGPMLRYSLGSALSQTVEDIEILVVGDGVPDVTREVVAELMGEDQRVRFFDNPKGPSRGEVHRHAALREARGEIVCYLADDDLWFPEHVENMRRLLAEVDFANALPLYVDEAGVIGLYTVDLTLPVYRRLLLRGTNRVPLSCGAHTMAMYRRLPHGWRTTPEGKPTDLHMWQQFLADSSCRARSGTRPTVLNFPSPARRTWTMEERLAELERWSEKAADAGWRAGGVASEAFCGIVHRHPSEEARWHARLDNQLRRVEEMNVEVRILTEKIRRIENSKVWRLLDKLSFLRSKVRGSRG